MKKADFQSNKSLFKSLALGESYLQKEIIFSWLNSTFVCISRHICIDENLCGLEWNRIGQLSVFKSVLLYLVSLYTPVFMRLFASRHSNDNKISIKLKST